MISGVHTMFYSSDADGLRAFLRDKLGFSGYDVGGGWLIFDLPKADMGVHPTDSASPPSGTAHLSFFCDDLDKTMSELSAKGVQFEGGVADQGWGRVTQIRAPGGFSIQLYQPLYGK